MIDQSDLNDEVLKEKIKILSDENNEIKKWNEGLFIKLLILLPTIIFIIGLFFVNKPESLTDILFILIYPLGLVSIGLIILFAMTSKLN